VKTAEIREKYLTFFVGKGCKRMPSSSLVPDDPSLLLTSAGMVQFKPYFLSQKHLEGDYIGVTTVQKCVRTNDIDVIGTDGRHLSFFEMLGNFSFGRYFKKEMCAWAYEFSVEILALDPSRLYFTVYTDDDETYDIWHALGIPEDHISRLGAEDNFWAAGPTGPCGPCSEIYYDQGPAVGCGTPDCRPGCECDRFLEFWNLVFTQYDRQEDGSMLPLPHKNIDTGMGVERIAAIMQDVTSNYDTDLLRSVVAVGEKLTGDVYGIDATTDLSLRIMADHARSVVFMIADGILPSNEGRGYVLRRLLRRAVLHGHLLGVDEPFFSRYIEAIVSGMGDVYPELAENRTLIDRLTRAEEQRFGMTLKQGLELIDKLLSEKPAGYILPGIDAFTLHDTYGFPLELTDEICVEHGFSVDHEGFGVEMDAQRVRARAAATGDAWATYGSVYSAIADANPPTDFIGYDHDSATGTVIALVSGTDSIERAEAGDDVDIILDSTPFYGEMGGQVGDAGSITGEGGIRASVLDTKVPETGLIVHKAHLEKGTVTVGDTVTASIDVMRRERIRRNHTATHLLHWALRCVLGEHVKQAGSLVAPERLRFDFTHFEPMTPAQVAEVERLVNEQIMENRPVRTYETSLSAARESGVTALFGEKYGEFVRVVEAGDVSHELCGGTHVGRTSEIGLIKILSESSIGSNTRRIEAVTSFDALSYVNRIEDALRKTALELKVPLADVPGRVAVLSVQLRKMESTARSAKRKALGSDIEELLVSATEARGGYPVLIARVEGLDAQGLRATWDVVQTKMSRPGAVVLLSKNGTGDPLLLAAGTDEAVGKGFDAGAVIRAIAPAIKGGGGGKPSMAQAGGRDVSGLDEAFRLAHELLIG
jgi:alanyl-tRNA synthetase